MQFQTHDKGLELEKPCGLLYKTNAMTITKSRYF